MKGRYLVVAGLLALLAACDMPPQGTSPPVLAEIEQGGGRMAWQGLQPCADCEGIDTRLMLVHEGGRRRFELIETYRSARPARFVLVGQWRREGDLLQLHADDDTRLVYAVLEDGRLQPRDGRGRRLATSDGDGLLLPEERSAGP